MSNVWKNVHGVLEIETTYQDGKLYDVTNDNKLFPVDLHWLAGLDDLASLEIHFLSSGFYDPGKIHGLPEDCYPPEGDDERILDKVALVFQDNVSTTYTLLNAEVAEQVFNHYIEQVNAVELEDEIAEHRYLGD